MSHTQQRSTALPWGRAAQGLHRIVQTGVLIYLLLLPFGKSFMEIGAWSASIAVLLLYVTGFKASNARKVRLPVVLFLLFWCYLVFTAFNSVMPSASWYNLKVNLHMGFGMFFAGLEFVRRKEDIRLPVYAITACGFAEGLDGVWQAITHSDLIHGTPMTTGGRLTGSFSTYRVGNLMAQYIPIMAGIWLMLRQRMSRLPGFVLTAVLVAPALFLLYGSKTRSAYAGFFLACLAAYFFLHKSWWKAALVICGGGLAALPFLSGRFSIQGVLNDPRISELWPLALDVFKEWPVFGAGAGTYNAAFRALGLAPATQGIDIPHPHNIYVQFLCETGFVGLIFFLVLTATLLFVLAKTILPKVRAEYPLLQRATDDLLWWRLTALFTASYIGYLGTAISAHNFFRSWWLGTASLLLGIALGFCAASQRPEFHGKQTNDKARSFT